jgi:hypothetical protein
MAEQTTQPEPEITLTEIELMECNTALNKILLHLQTNTLPHEEKKEVLSVLATMYKNLQKLRVKIEN